MGFGIKSIAKYLPANIIDSAELDQRARVREGWIEKNTGVAQRHWATQGESVCEMGAKALKLSLKQGGLVPSDLGMLIFAGGSFDYPVPHNSVIVKSLVADDTSKFNCLDVDTTCLSFIQALDIAALYLDAGRCDRIAIVSAEMPSRALHPDDPKVFGLFGDAAVAVILERAGNLKIAYADFQNFVSGALFAHIPWGGAKNRGLGMDAQHQDFCFQMQGKKLMKLGARHLKAYIRKLEQDAGVKMTDIDYIIPHQPSKIANDFFIRDCGLSEAKVVSTMAECGNCISASVPLGLEQIYNGGAVLGKGKKILLIGSGAGFTFGCVLLEVVA